MAVAEETGAGRWIWLFPVAILAHVAEEALAGETFPAWVSRVAGVDVSMSEFLVMNVVALVVVTAGAAIAARPGGAWATAALGAAVLANALFHLAGVLASGWYAPGIVTAVLLWTPLGVLALVHAVRCARGREVAIGVLVGMAAHGVVLLSVAVS